MNLNSEKIRFLMGRLHNGYSASEVKTVGKSWSSRDIISSSTGHGSKNVLIIGGLGGKDLCVSDFLSGFSHELDEKLASKGRISDFNISALCSKSKIHIISMLNPDGIILNNLGILPDNPFYGRVSGMMKGSGDFNKWDANIRGVSLYGNFNRNWIRLKLSERSNGIFMNSPSGYFGEYPESELEVSSLCSFARVLKPGIVFELRLCDNNCIIPVVTDENKYRITAFSRVISEYTNIKVVEDKSFENGTFSSWVEGEFDCLAFIMGITEKMSHDNVNALKNAILLGTAL